MLTVYRLTITLCTLLVALIFAVTSLWTLCWLSLACLPVMLICGRKAYESEA